MLPIKLIKNELLAVFLFFTNKAIPNNEIGITTSFKCSHTLSFTGVKIPIKVFLFEASYAKCSNTP